MTMGRPESYIFAYKDQSTIWAVRVAADSTETAKAVFSAMSRAERLRNAICAMERDESDHARLLGAWMANLFRRGTGSQPTAR